MTLDVHEHHQWELAAGRSLLLDEARILAIVNVTPDSFSDGGDLTTIREAVDFSLACLHDGADMLDIGGESTRPGAKRVEAAEQIARVGPVISGILQTRPEALISVDTTLPAVAEAALAAGAVVINDVSAGLEGGDEMFAIVAAHGAGLILMHRLLPPDRDRYSDAYAVGEEPDYAADVVVGVRIFLKKRAEAAQQAGIQKEKIVLDPGLGFGKTVRQNFALIHAAGDLQVDLGYPLLSAASRKSFIGAVTGVEDPQQRVAGSVAITVAHYLAGIRLFRVHDVAAQREALRASAAGSETA